MKKLIQVCIPSIFDIVGNSKILGTALYPNKLISYKCSCGAYYEVLRKYNRKSASLTGYAYQENHAICPTCGRQYHLSRDLQYGTAPYSATISLYELRKDVVLKFKYAIPLWNKKYAPKGTVYEELRFNIKERKTTFIQNRKKYFVGIPNDNFMQENSLMRFLSCRSMATKEFPALTQLLKNTREAVTRKFKEIHGYRLKSLFVGHDTVTGKIAFPLFNIAYRLIFADSPNLNLQMLSHDVFVNMLFIKGYDNKALKNINTKNPYLWLMRNYGIPQKPFYEKLIIENPMYFKILAESSRLFGNPDYQQRLVNILITTYEVRCGITKPYSHRFLGYVSMKKLFSALQYLKNYPAKGVLHLLETKDYAYIVDMVRMLEALPNKYRTLSAKVKIQDLHDWVTNKTYEMKHADYPLGIPQQMIDKFTQSLNGIQFAVPKTRYELRDIGRYLKNCVYSYAEQCKKGECQIVVAMQHSKYIACMEIRNNTLKQAKLFANEKVCGVGELNCLVKDWCKLAGVIPDTIDVTI